MREIKLTQGKVTLVDDEDFERLNRHKWYASRSGQSWYAQRNDYSNGKRKTIIMHREIMNIIGDIGIDHITGNGLHNLKENLRVATHQQNMHNRKLPQKNNKLGIKGVSWHKASKKFRAQIRINDKLIHLGIFTVLADAEQAYRVAEIKYFGEFAREETKKLYLVV